MDKPLISVIIPYYNTTGVLFDHCIESLRSQSLQTFEIIVIDDGSSPDHSSYLTTKYGNDKQIVLIHIQKCGVSRARNTGISAAKGSFICFVDSDDYVAPYMLEDLYRCLDRSQTDICISYLSQTDIPNHPFIRNREYKIISMGNPDDKRLVNSLILRGINTKKHKYGYLSFGPCAIMLKKSTADQFPFPDEIAYMEDVIWNYRLFNSLNRIAILNETTYAYVSHSDSTTHKYKKEIIEKRISSLDKIYSLIRNDPDCIPWYNLRLLCNISIICYQYAHFSENRLLTKLIMAYKTIYQEKWRKKITWETGKNWESRYKLKLLLYKLFLLPIVHFSKELLFTMQKDS